MELDTSFEGNTPALVTTVLVAIIIAKPYRAIQFLFLFENYEAEMKEAQ